MLHNDKVKFSIDADREIVGNGGFSFSLDGGRKPDGGYMVSLPGFETVYKHDVENARSFNRSAIHRYLESVSPIVESVFPSAFVGGWYHDGALYLDLSIQVPDIVDALRLAKSWNQLAIYDVSNGISLELEWFRPSSIATGLQTGSTGKHYPVAIYHRGDADCVYLPLSPMGVDYVLHADTNRDGGADRIAQLCFDAVNS